MEPRTILQFLQVVLVGLPYSSADGHITDCGTEYSMANGYANFTGRETTYQMQVPLFCNEGYDLHGDNFTECLDNGMWSENSHCHIKDCGSEYSMANGDANFTERETTYQMQVPLFCNEGYDLHGENFTECLANGMWSKNSHCHIKDCGTEYSMANGYANFTERETTYQMQVPLFCNEGYDLHGEKFTECLANGMWSKNSHCHIKDCGDEYPLEHGFVNFSGADTEFGSNVAVSCDLGYMVQGSSNITCLASGRWSTDSKCVFIDCGTDFSISHGYANFAGRETTFQKEIPLFCNEGYDLHGDQFTKCLENAMWSKASHCHIKRCEDNYSVENGHVNISERGGLYGDTVPVKCNEGYEIEGALFITCQSDGNWTTDSACVLRDCGDYYHLDHGSVDFTNKSTEVHQAIHVTCDTGYEIHGDQQITCLPDGTWSKFTRCMKKDCGPSYSIDNGHADFSEGETTYGSEIPVLCNNGYELNGDNCTVCQEDGNWSNNTECIIKDCGTSYALEHGHVILTGVETTYNSKLPVTCETGYEIEGDAFITCLSDGKWTTTLCRKKDCGEVYNIAHGYVNFTGLATTYEERIPVSCYEGYELVGEEAITCLADGTWSKDTLCRIKDCGIMSTIADGYAIFSGATTFDSQALVTCRNGYENQGETSITCLAGGSWSAHSSCRPKDCGDYYNLTHGHVNFTGYETTYNEMVPVTCDDGYEMEVNKFITCLPNGDWNSVTCQPKDCGASYTIEHGEVDFAEQETIYGSLVPVSCNPGYELYGEENIVCGHDGTWSKLSSCRIKDCGTEYTLAHGYAMFEGKETTYGQSVDITCVNGYTASGDGTITCQADGHWSNTSCHMIDCGTHYELENGHVDLTDMSTGYDAKIPVTCNVGHFIIGSPHITCLLSGIWSTDTECRIHDCGGEYEIDGGHALIDGVPTTYNHTIDIECNEGYDLVGAGYSLCLENGTWSRTTTCNIKDCGEDYHINHGHVNFTGRETTFSQTIPVECDIGYEIQGQANIICLSSGSWSEDSSCEIKDCGESYTLAHGHANFTDRETTFNQTVPVFCYIGYEITGEEHITCLHTGSWSTDTECKIKDCGSTYDIAHGHIDFTGQDTTFNQSIPVTCNVGYQLHGEENIICLSSGNWSEETSCIIKDCGANYNLPNGFVNFTVTETTYNEMVPVHCDVGYEIEGEHYITCLSDGTWSENTTCQAKDCGIQYNLEHGYVNFTGRDTTYKSELSVNCEDGYAVVGDHHITCLGDGSWSTSTSCHIDCGAVYSLDHGSVDFAGHETTDGHSIPVACDVGYELQGNGHIVCQFNGNWTTDTVCRIRDCGNVFVLQHGHANFTGRETTYNHNIPLKCNEGYEMNGDPFTTCLANGTWSKLTTCAIIDCGDIYSIEKGEVDFTDKLTTYNQSVPVSCHHGYIIEGPEHIICQANGNWSADTTCSIIETPTPLLSYPDRPSNVFKISVSYLKRLHIFKVSCYFSNFSTSRGLCCVRSVGIQQCATDCGTSYVLPNGQVDFNNKDTTFNQTIPVTCNTGYDIQGDDHITCLLDGNWSTLTSCEIKDCGDVYEINHGHVNFTERATTYGETITVTCNEGYNLAGGTEITCQEDGTWSTTTHCEILDCGTDYTLINGHANFAGRDTVFQSTVPVSCAVGYDLEGDSEITCLSDGLWAGEVRCNIKDCMASYTLLNGFVNFTGKVTTYEAQVAATCNEGYEIEGDPKITCQADGTWSDNTACRALPAKEKDDTVAIVAGTVGGVVGVSLIALVIFVLKKKGMACFVKTYDLGPGVPNSTALPKPAY